MRTDDGACVAHRQNEIALIPYLFQSFGAKISKFDCVVAIALEIVGIVCAIYAYSCDFIQFVLGHFFIDT